MLRENRFHRDLGKPFLVEGGVLGQAMSAEECEHAMAAGRRAIQGVAPPPPPLPQRYCVPLTSEHPLVPSCVSRMQRVLTHVARELRSLCMLSVASSVCTAATTDCIQVRSRIGYAPADLDGGGAVDEVLVAWRTEALLDLHLHLQPRKLLATANFAP